MSAAGIGGDISKMHRGAGISSTEVNKDTREQDGNSMFVRFLLSTGDSKVFKLNPSATVEQSKEYVFDNWPEGLAYVILCFQSPLSLTSLQSGRNLPRSLPQQYA